MHRFLIVLALFLAASPLAAQSLYYSNNSDHSAIVEDTAIDLAASLGGSATGFNAASDTEWATALSGADYILLGQDSNVPGSVFGDIGSWVSSGGVLLTFGGSPQDVLGLLNSVTGGSMAQGACESSSSTKMPEKTPEVSGTSFDSAPAGISAAVSNWCAIQLASLSGSGVAAYLDEVNDVHVLVEPVGSGLVSYLSWDFCCSATDDERDGWEAALFSAATFAGGDQSAARFKVTKMFSDGSTDEVDVTLTCNTGLPLKQDSTIAGGDPEGVTFVVTDIPEGGADCEVTESGVPSGYTAVLNGGDGCEWEDVTGGLKVCSIYNEANPATYTVLKDWTVYREGGDVVLSEADVTIECNAAIVGGVEDDGTWTLSDTLGDGETLVATVDTTLGPATCSATEEITESGVEQSASGCGPVPLPAGGSHTCTFTNTVFFEGIPTLSQYGMAILVLLTLGVGFVGLRRFV